MRALKIARDYAIVSHVSASIDEVAHGCQVKREEKVVFYYSPSARETLFT